MSETATKTALPAASYARLHDNTWGMRVAGVVAPGTRVLMSRKDGTTHEATVGEVTRRYGGRNPATIARIVHSGERKAPRGIPGAPRPEPTPAPQARRVEVEVQRCRVCRTPFGPSWGKSPRTDPAAQGACEVCCPPWPVCGCGKVGVDIYGRDGWTCSPCERAAAFDRAFNEGFLADQRAAAEVEKAFTRGTGGRDFTEFASDLRHIGFGVGVWPVQAVYAGEVFTRVAAENVLSGGEFQAAVYRSAGGSKLTVFNT